MGAVKGPSDKWALINSGSVKDELSLDQPLRIVQGNEKKHRAYVLAYRRRPLATDNP